ncbi:MAG: site-specific integrase [Bacteroidota bacterium]
MQKATTGFVLDKRRMLKEGGYPVKLRVTFNRKSRLYDTGLKLTDKAFAKTFSERPREQYKENKNYLAVIEAKAEKIIKNLTLFSFNTFKELMFSDEVSKLDVYSHFEKKIQALHTEGRVKTAQSYRNALNSLKSFKKSLQFPDITPQFLESYHNYMVSRGRSQTTVGIYLRSLRAIFNQAIKYGVDVPYPFGRNGYTPPQGKNIKKALTFSQIEQIYKYSADIEQEQYARDMFVFSYLCNGMNMKDVALLKFKNIAKDKIIFVRAKTSRTKKQTKPIQCIITDEVQAIIDRWGNKAVHSDSFLFPILQPTDTPTEQAKKISQAIKTINKWLSRIADKLGIDQKVTTYTARHSFATVLKRSNTSTEFISEALGHTSLSTTESYLDSFEDQQLHETMKSLTNF